MVDSYVSCQDKSLSKQLGGITVLPLLRPPSPLHRSLCCLIALTEWVIVPHLMCYILLSDITGLHMSNLGTSVPQRPCSVLCNNQEPIDHHTKINIY